MRERPILFSGPMVRAILEGRKTQARRVAMMTKCGVRVFALGCDPAPDAARCPYGAPGDRLWVRETWAMPRAFDAHSPTTALRRTRGLPNRFYRADEKIISAGAYTGERGRWRSPIHMPRWASRLTLTITDVRVERLQDITEADAQAEGCPVTHDGHPYDPPSQDTWQGYGRASFSLLWSKIHGPGAWDANPWVWVVTFEREAPRG